MTPSYLTCSIIDWPCPGLSLDHTTRIARTTTHWRTTWRYCQKTNPGKSARKTTWRHSQKNSLANQPKKQPGDTARNTTWRHSQKNNLATQPEIQSGDTARRTIWRHSWKNDLHQTWRVGSPQWVGGHLHRKSAIERRPSTNWLPSAPNPKPPPLNKPK